MRRVPFLLLTLLLAVLLVFLLWLGWTLTHPKVSQSLIFSPDQLPTARISQSYSATITISNNLTPVGEISVADGTLPRGLILHHARGDSTAEISGIPAESGDFKFTISAWCFGTNVSGQTGQRAYSLTVKYTESPVVLSLQPTATTMQAYKIPTGCKSRCFRRVSKDHEFPRRENST